MESNSQCCKAKPSRFFPLWNNTKNKDLNFGQLSRQVKDSPTPGPIVLGTSVIGTSARKQCSLGILMDTISGLLGMVQSNGQSCGRNISMHRSGISEVMDSDIGINGQQGDVELEICNMATSVSGAASLYESMEQQTQPY